MNFLGCGRLSKYLYVGHVWYPRPPDCNDPNGSTEEVKWWTDLMVFWGLVFETGPCAWLDLGLVQPAWVDGKIGRRTWNKTTLHRNKHPVVLGIVAQKQLSKRRTNVKQIEQYHVMVTIMILGP